MKDRNFVEFFQIQFCDFFVSEWKLERNLNTGERMIGLASISEDSGLRLSYEENLKVELQEGRVLNGFQKYFYHATEEGMDIYFSEMPEKLFQISCD